MIFIKDKRVRGAGRDEFWARVGMKKRRRRLDNLCRNRNGKASDVQVESRQFRVHFEGAQLS